MGLSVVIITKNEAHDLPHALKSVAFADEVIVFDSGSTDGTQKIAEAHGAKVFESTDWPGFGPQKNRALERASHDWVLSLDADEWLTPDLANQIREVVSAGHNAGIIREKTPRAFRFRRRSIFIDRVMRYGDWRRDRVLRLFQRGSAEFSSDLVHERLVVSGTIADLPGYLMHHSVRSLDDSKEKMWQYSRVAALKLANEGRGGRTSGLLKAGFSLFRGLVLRGGVFDGLRGLQLAWFNAAGTYLRYAAAQSIRDQDAFRRGDQSWSQRLSDHLSLMFVDHGFLRSLYQNRFRLAGGLYRANQPTPRRLAFYQKALGIKTVVNLRGKNDQLGWYRLEEQACKRLGLTLVSTQVYSRGLLTSEEFAELKRIVGTIELPAIVHCKSGADRAGFFAACYRHFRLGEPVEHALSELSWRYGHFSSAKTGILDHFFSTYLKERQPSESISSWVDRAFSKERLESSFKPAGVGMFIVDKVLRRE